MSQSSVCSSSLLLKAPWHKAKWTICNHRGKASSSLESCPQHTIQVDSMTWPVCRLLSLSLISLRVQPPQCSVRPALKDGQCTEEAVTQGGIEWALLQLKYLNWNTYRPPFQRFESRSWYRCTWTVLTAGLALFCSNRSCLKHTAVVNLPLWF
jgi:hypothetical protein